MCISCSQVALNQLALGPVVMSASFAWNLSFTGQSDKILSKIKNDGPTTLQNGKSPPHFTFHACHATLQLALAVHCCCRNVNISQQLSAFCMSCEAQI